MAKKPKKKAKGIITIHHQFEALVKLMRKLHYSFLEDGVLLSGKAHRGPMCKHCRRPTASKLAYSDASKDGDMPDLCWDNCEHE